MIPERRALACVPVRTGPRLPDDDELTELLAQILERAWRRRHPELLDVNLETALENMAARNGKPGR